MLWELGRDNPDLLGNAAGVSRTAARSRLDLVADSPTRTGTLTRRWRSPRALIARSSYAREDAPNECCGLVAGAERGCDRVFRARNELATRSPTTFYPQDLLRITNEIDDAGEELAAIYHCTGARPRPSQTDINLAANWPDPVYLICSIADADAPVVRGWHLRDGKVAEVELSVG